MILDPSFIGSVGFPIAVTSYLLFKFEKTLKDNTEATRGLHQYLKNNKRFK